MFEHEPYRWTYITRERKEEIGWARMTCCSSTSPFPSFAVTAVDGEDPSRRIDVVPGDQGELTAPFPEQVFLGRRKLAVWFGTSGGSAGLVCLDALSLLFNVHRYG
jgi:hypothetical protein